MSEKISETLASDSADNLSETNAGSREINRRQFGKSLTASVALSQLAINYIPAHAMGKFEKPALAGIGTGGKGRSDIEGCQKAGFDIVSLVDVVDAKKLGKVTDKRVKSTVKSRGAFPQARYFSDYREMLTEMGDKIDAVTVSTPDHHHFHASTLAMQAGKHVYCQKPLTRNIWEARKLAEIAAGTGVKTQMGNQAHANDHMRRCVELLRAGIIGDVKEIHAWTNRPIWPQGFNTPPPKESIPEAMNWEQWIGPGEWVDYSSKIAPFAWRGWWNYGTGALGDMACHIMDMGWWAMLPGAPVSFTAQQSGATDLSPPINSKIEWQFGPGRFSKKGFKFLWYDGYIDAVFDRDNWKLAKNGDEYNHPNDKVLEGLSFKDYGSVIVGSEGKLFFNRSRNNWVIKPSSIVDGFTWPDQSLPRATGQNPYMEWLDAIQGKINQAESHFGHAGPFTETILLGVLAQRFPNTELEWDAENMKIAGRDDLQKYIRTPYRKGWELDV